MFQYNEAPACLKELNNKLWKNSKVYVAHVGELCQVVVKQPYRSMGSRGEISLNPYAGQPSRMWPVVVSHEVKAHVSIRECYYKKYPPIVRGKERMVKKLNALENRLYKQMMATGVKHLYRFYRDGVVGPRVAMMPRTKKNSFVLCMYEQFGLVGTFEPLEPEDEITRR